MESSIAINRINTLVNHLLILSLLLLLSCTRSKSDADVNLESNKALVLRIWEEGFNQGNIKVIEDLFDEKYIERTPYRTIKQGGPERAKYALKYMRSVFGDLHFEVEQILAEDNFVISRAMITGTHIGEFLGVAATNKPVRFAAVVISKISDGKTVEDWSIVDTYAVLRQLGEITVVSQE